MIDLDPEAGAVEPVRAATVVVRSILQSFGVDGFALATGSKGFHVWVPIDGDLSFDEVPLVSRAIAGWRSTADPDGWHIGQIEQRLELDTSPGLQPIPVSSIIEAARKAGVDLDTPHDRFGRTEV